jgi:hypothetical protein
MPVIQAIICFNGGSAGDFLAGICSEQLLGVAPYKIFNNGLAELSHKFKNATEVNYYSSDALVDLSKAMPVENTHYYLDYYPQIAQKLFYINYPDEISQDIVNIFMFKRFANDTERMSNFMKQSYTGPMRSKLNASNIIDACKINWTKNIRSWRNNPLLEPLHLRDLFDRSTFYNMVETVCQCKIKDYGTLSAGYDSWISKNDRLRQLFL